MMKPDTDIGNPAASGVPSPRDWTPTTLADYLAKRIVALQGTDLEGRIAAIIEMGINTMTDCYRTRLGFVEHDLAEALAKLEAYNSVEEPTCHDCGRDSQGCVYCNECAKNHPYDYVQDDLNFDAARERGR